MRAFQEKSKELGIPKNLLEKKKLGAVFEPALAINGLFIYFKCLTPIGSMYLSSPSPSTIIHAATSGNTCKWDARHLGPAKESEIPSVLVMEQQDKQMF